MKNRQEVETAVIAKTNEWLNIPLENIKPDSRFVKDLGADSLDVVELVMALEDDFRLEINDEDAEKINSVKDAVDYLVVALKITDI